MIPISPSWRGSKRAVPAEFNRTGRVCGGGRRGPNVRCIREDDRNESLCHKASHRLKRIARPLPDRRINVCLLFPYPKLRSTMLKDRGPLICHRDSKIGNEYGHRVYYGERMYECSLYLLNIDYPASPCISPINSSSEPMALLPLWISWCIRKGIAFFCGKNVLDVWRFTKRFLVH